jgi:hypothetical protein
MFDAFFGGSDSNDAPAADPYEPPPEPVALQTQWPGQGPTPTVTTFTPDRKPLWATGWFDMPWWGYHADTDPRGLPLKNLVYQVQQGRMPSTADYAPWAQEQQQQAQQQQAQQQQLSLPSLYGLYDIGSEGNVSREYFDQSVNPLWPFWMDQFQDPGARFNRNYMSAQRGPQPPSMFGYRGG